METLSRVRDENRVDVSSAVRTTRPAARPAHAFAHLVETCRYAALSRLFFCRRGDPTDPLIARERRNVFPQRECFRIGYERLPQVRWHCMDETADDSLQCHDLF